jgi:hypothetical protein
MQHPTTSTSTRKMSTRTTKHTARQIAPARRGGSSSGSRGGLPSYYVSRWSAPRRAARPINVERLAADNIREFDFVAAERDPDVSDELLDEYGARAGAPQYHPPGREIINNSDIHVAINGEHAVIGVFGEGGAIYECRVVRVGTYVRCDKAVRR